MFKVWEREASRLLDLKLVAPGYDAVIKCSHVFNLLDARGAISVSERVGYIGRVRKIARQAALAHHHLRAELGYPLIPDAAERERWLGVYAEQQAKAQGARRGKGGKGAAPAAESPGGADAVNGGAA
jgi:glycyl-tRNA synthetase alpha chain